MTGPAAHISLPATTLAAFGKVVPELGTPHFDAVLLAAIESAVAVDSMATVTFQPETGLRTLGVGSRRNLAHARSWTHAYVSLHHRLDPNFAEIVRRRRGVLVRRHDPGRLASRVYQERFFGRSGAVDKVAYVWWTNGVGYYANLYRLDPSPPFSDADAACLRNLAPMVASLYSAHDARLRLKAARHSGSPERLAETVVSALGVRLSTRERDVLSRTLLGLRTEGVSLELGIKPTTVITLRKRAYAKLGIASHAELFALCLGCLPSAGTIRKAADRPA
jgi:DNA-binding CsgD family transcriptional regulator